MELETIIREAMLDMEHQVELGLSDPEVAHGEADEILCRVMRYLGFGDLVDLWDEVAKWYA